MSLTTLEVHTNKHLLKDKTEELHLEISPSVMLHLYIL